MRVGALAYLLHGGGGYRSAGVSTYIERLIGWLPRVAPENEYLVFRGADAPPLRDIESIVSRVPTKRPMVRIPWEQTAVPIEAARRHVDVLHGTVNVIPLAARCPSVVTVHDLSFLRYPEYFNRLKAVYLRQAMGLSTRRADRVIAVSHRTRRDLQELLDIPEEKIEVIYQGVDERFAPLPAATVRAFREKAVGGRPYLLHVGTLEPRKNLETLVRAFGRVRKQLGIAHVLALVGGRGWMSESLFATVEHLGLREAVVFLDYVPSDDLPLWYNSAELFAYPSFYEGFGLPVLEAMACGTPVVTSAGTAAGEVVGDAGMTVEPQSEEDLEVAISRLLSDPDLRGDMRQRGLRRAAEFSWERTARETAATYRAVMDEQ